MNYLDYSNSNELKLYEILFNIILSYKTNLLYLNVTFLKLDFASRIFHFNLMRRAKFQTILLRSKIILNFYHVIIFD
jgi:hypothetical protein